MPAVLGGGGHGLTHRECVMTVQQIIGVLLLVLVVIIICKVLGVF